METGGAAVRAADIPRASLTVVLVDSTGYGWLPGQKLGDAAMDFRKCGGVETVASIVSGGSIVKAGKKDGTNILDQFMQWVLDGGEETHGGDVEVEVGVVPARDSVQGARYLERIRNLAAALKNHPLLPPKLPGFDVQEADHASGILFPNVHCAIQGCVWCSKEDPCQPNWTHARVMQVQQQRWTERPQTCCGNARTCLRAHLSTAHKDLFAEARPSELLSDYLAAVALTEKQQVPRVGWSTDRRTFHRLAREVTEQHMEGLICACCARIHVAANHGETGFQTVSDLFSNLTEDSFRANWCYATYASRYANIPAIQQRLEHKQWVRQLPDGSNILCCPEDIRCVKCTLQSSTLCPRCRVPLCRTCLMRMTQRRRPGPY